MVIKHSKADISKFSLEEIESLYKQSVELTKNDDFSLSEENARNWSSCKVMMLKIQKQGKR